jgi:D-beta-D-heptose 7-phosphate kinase/D-beta-D-heptose 1-phosphate adenosyltransferase
MGKPLRFCIAGAFDPIHDGHIDHITKASLLKGADDSLIVILAREDQIIAKKGYSFYESLRTRHRIVSAIKGIDAVFINKDTDTSCAETLRWLKPDYFIKGGDRTPENMPSSEIQVCREIGCKIIYGLGDLLNSSSSLVRGKR